MSGLVIKLAPKERVLINGAVIENGERRCKVSIVTPDANILRLRDAIHPEEATTPVRRVCYAAQLILTGDSDPRDVHLAMLRNIEELSQVFTDPDSRSALTEATKSLIQNNHYKCLKALRSLLPREERFIAARPV
jgi:flagellar biosynthesis repressor protein FlbT